MERLATKPLPPLAENHRLKAILRRIDAAGSYADSDLGQIIEAAGNISREEDQAIRLVLGADDVERQASEGGWKRFNNEILAEATCRAAASSSRLRAGISRGLTGGATGLAAGVATAPVLDLPHQVLACVAAVVLGAYLGFRNGYQSDYGVHN